MLSSRCESSHRNYTELCNRSSTSSLGLSHVGSPSQPTSDTLEDYWEDASVSLRSRHSWEASPSPWLSLPASPAHEKIDVEDRSKSFSGSDSDRIWHRSCSSDASEYVASLKAERRSFPPPLALCSTVSIKGGGRFVLKEMDADRPQGFFRAQRGNGRLRLELILPDEEEDNHEESFSPVEDMAECAEFDHGEHGSHVEEATLGIHEDCSTADKDGMDGMNAEFDIPAAAQQFGLEVEGETKSSLEGVFSDDPNPDAGFSELDSYLADNFLTFGKLELDQFVANSTNSHVEQEPLWNVDARKQALASLSPWSANQICVHQSIAHIRPALGLAMS